MWPCVLEMPEIQDTIRDAAPGGPIKTMRRTVNWSVALMTAFYLAVAISGERSCRAGQGPAWAVQGGGQGRRGSGPG